MNNAGPKVVLGISFRSGTAAEVVEVALRAGLVVIPSAPVLVRMTEDEAHREALLKADLAVVDSGLMVLVWRLFTGRKLVRVSGLEYLWQLLALPELREPGKVAWIMPSVASRDRNITWLRANGHATTDDDCYVAPQYPMSGPLHDLDLLAWVKSKQPRHLIIALGGGVQERLGHFLNQALLKETTAGIHTPPRDWSRPCIHCVGAAIGFASGDQVRIPGWADFLYMGWLFRCLAEPARFLPRYRKALGLVPLLWRWREAPPQARPGPTTGQADG